MRKVPARITVVPLFFLLSSCMYPARPGVASPGDDEAGERVRKPEAPPEDPERAALRRSARENPGDPRRGAQVFLKASCVTCHGLPGQGGDIGPDLKGIGRRDREFLITAVLDPAASLRAGYGTVRITTRDGQELKGAFVKETAEAIHFLDSQGRPQQLRKDALKEFERQSPMPAQLWTLFDPSKPGQDLADLVSYLQSLE